MQMKAWPAQGRVQVPVCHTCNKPNKLSKTVSWLLVPSFSHLWRACILTVAGGYLRRQQAGAPAPPLIIGPYTRRCTLVLHRQLLLKPSLKVAGLSDGRVATTTGSCRIPTGKTLNHPFLRRNLKKSGIIQKKSEEIQKIRKSCHYQQQQQPVLLRIPIGKTLNDPLLRKLKMRLFTRYFKTQCANVHLNEFRAICFSSI